MKAALNGTVDKHLAETMIDSVRAHIEADEFWSTVKSVSEKSGVKFDC